MCTTQAAAFYADLSLAENGRGGVAAAHQHHGKVPAPPSFLSAASVASITASSSPAHMLSHRFQHHAIRSCASLSAVNHLAHTPE